VTASSHDEEYEMTFTHDAGEDLRPLLAAAVSDGPAAPDLLSGVRRARRRRRVLVPATSLAAAGALSVAALAVLSVEGAPSAQAQVTAAATHSSGQSFHVHITDGTSQMIPYDGEFDPASRTGRLATGAGIEIRYVGDTRYLRPAEMERPRLPKGKAWISEPRPDHGGLLPIGVVQVLDFGPQDSQSLLARLRSATSVRETGRASGTGWTGHRYAYSVPGERNVVSISGTVDVDSRGMVRVLSLSTRISGVAKKFGDATSRTVMEFSDYGTRVQVAAPPADQVIRADRIPPRIPPRKPSSGMPAPKRPVASARPGTLGDVIVG
jgi:hypothetical protein